MGAKIGVIFIVIVVLGIGLYLYNSGVITSGINQLKSIAPFNTPTSTGSAPAAPPMPGTAYVPPPSPAPAPTPVPTPTPAPAQTINPADIPPGFTVNQLSPYFHEVRIGGLSPGPTDFYSGGYGQISLYASYDNPSTTVDVTGWEVKSNRGGVFVPQAVQLYDPFGLNPPSDIIMKNADQLYIYSSSAPVNLRLNECIGYLPNRSQFNPTLPQSCPSVQTQGIQSFTGACQNYIYSLNGCQQPDFADPNFPSYDYACEQYLTGKYNYSWCYNTYFSDSQFLSNQIWVWTGSSPLDPSHDQAELLDRNGLLVDYTTY